MASRSGADGRSAAAGIPHLARDDDTTASVRATDISAAIPSNENSALAGLLGEMSIRDKWDAVADVDPALGEAASDDDKAALSSACESSTPLALVRFLLANGCVDHIFAGANTGEACNVAFAVAMRKVNTPGFWMGSWPGDDAAGAMEIVTLHTHDESDPGDLVVAANILTIIHTAAFNCRVAPPTGYAATLVEFLLALCSAGAASVEVCIAACGAIASSSALLSLNPLPLVPHLANMLHAHRRQLSVVTAVCDAVHQVAMYCHAEHHEAFLMRLARLRPSPLRALTHALAADASSDVAFLILVTIERLLPMADISVDRSWLVSEYITALRRLRTLAIRDLSVVEMQASSVAGRSLSRLLALTECSLFVARVSELAPGMPRGADVDRYSIMLVTKAMSVLTLLPSPLATVSGAAIATALCPFRTGLKVSPRALLASMHALDIMRRVVISCVREGEVFTCTQAAIVETTLATVLFCIKEHPQAVVVRRFLVHDILPVLTIILHRLMQPLRTFSVAPADARCNACVKNNVISIVLDLLPPAATILGTSPNRNLLIADANLRRCIEVCVKVIKSHDVTHMLIKCMYYLDVISAICLGKCDSDRQAALVACVTEFEGIPCIVNRLSRPFDDEHDAEGRIHYSGMICLSVLGMCGRSTAILKAGMLDVCVTLLQRCTAEASTGTPVMLSRAATVTVASASLLCTLLKRVKAEEVLPLLHASPIVGVLDKIMIAFEMSVGRHDASGSQTWSEALKEVKELHTVVLKWLRTVPFPSHAGAATAGGSMP